MTQLRASSRKLLLAVVLGMFSLPARAEVHRDPSVIREFKRTHVCPSTGTYSQKCAYQVDHAIPLCAGGYDGQENLQYLSKEDHLAKSKHDWRQCAAKRKGDPRWMDVR